jgi:hypothetical protein
MVKFNENGLLLDKPLELNERISDTVSMLWHDFSFLVEKEQN